jgi:hypothetical protein
MFVELPDGTRADAGLHQPILDGAEISPELWTDRVERLTRLGFTPEEIDAYFDRR